MSTTKHTHPSNFGRRVAGCPRCAELNNGAPAVQGWGARRAAFEMESVRAIREHDCKASRCGPVCTFGQW